MSESESWSTPQAFLLTALTILFVVAFIAIGSLVLQICWNQAVGPVFGLGEIGFFQAAGLIIAARILLQPIPSSRKE